MKKGYYKNVVLYTRFPRHKLDVKIAFQRLAKKQKIDANKLAIQLIEDYVRSNVVESVE